MPFMRYGALAILFSLTIAGSSPAMRGATVQRLPATVLVRVVEATSERPLPNAEVSAASLRRLTDARGEVRFSWPADGTLTLRVRQLGFRYVDRTLRRGTSVTATEDTVVISLARAPFSLPQVATRVNRRCASDRDPVSAALSSSSMDLLRFGAEQYSTFSAAYPFRVSLARRTVRRPAGGGPAKVEEIQESTQSDEWGQPYRPGRVLNQSRVNIGFFVDILFVSTLADSTFWDRHCFVARGVETRDGRRTIRLDFTPARGVRDVDWAGSAWIDSAASVLTRVDFRLTNLRSGDAVRRLEGYTIFAVLSPYIATPDSTVAWWWSRSRPGRNANASSADVVQSLTTQELAYLRAMPPQATATSDADAER